MRKTVLVIDNNGKIKEKLDDDFFLAENKNNFLELINIEHYSKYFGLMHELGQGITIKNLAIFLNTNNKSSLFFINAYKLNKETFVSILTANIIEKVQVIKDMFKIYDLKAENILSRNVTKDYNELSRLNNRLINIQRELSRTNFKLKNLNIQLESIIESIQEYLVLIDLEGEIVISNSNYNDFFNEKKNVFQFIKNNNKYVYEKIMKEGHLKEYIYLNDIKLKSHRDRFFDVKVVPIFDDEGEKQYYVLTFDDVTKRMKNIRRLRNLKMAFNQSKENIAITDTDFKIIFANQSFISEYGFSEEKEVLDRDIRNLIEKIKKPNKNEAIEREIFYNQKINGDYFPIEISKSEVELGNEVISHIYFVKNIAEQLEHEEKLILLAKKDQMTETYSREAGLAYLKDLLIQQENSSLEVSILFLDINALKEVNDNFGHQTGDELITQVVEAIKESTRSDDIIARLGGDEFLIILPDSDRKNAEMIKNRIKKNTENRNEKKDFSISVSIGIASSGEIESKNTDELINLADHRMYEAKNKFYKEKRRNPR